LLNITIKGEQPGGKAGKKASFQSENPSQQRLPPNGEDGTARYNENERDEEKTAPLSLGSIAVW